MSLAVIVSPKEFPAGNVGKMFVRVGLGADGHLATSYLQRTHCGYERATFFLFYAAESGFIATYRVIDH